MTRLRPWRAHRLSPCALDGELGGRQSVSCHRRLDCGPKPLPRCQVAPRTGTSWALQTYRTSRIRPWIPDGLYVPCAYVPVRARRSLKLFDRVHAPRTARALHAHSVGRRRGSDSALARLATTAVKARRRRQWPGGSARRAIEGYPPNFFSPPAVRYGAIFFLVTSPYQIL